MRAMDTVKFASLPELLKKGDERALLYCRTWDLDPKAMMRGKTAWTVIGFLGFLRFLGSLEAPIVGNFGWADPMIRDWVCGGPQPEPIITMSFATCLKKN